VTASGLDGEQGADQVKGQSMKQMLLVVAAGFGSHSKVAKRATFLAEMRLVVL
jgi:hypothetical protein